MKIVKAIFVYTSLVNVCVVGSHSGHGHSGLPSHTYGNQHVSSSHAHYTYHPPRYITYTCRYCTSPSTYPVYRHPLPSYVYVYKDSDSRYNQLLTGLALFNLGRTVEGGRHPNLRYTAQPQEKCSLQVVDRYHFEETEFPCFMISSFIPSASSKNTTTIDITSSKIDVKAWLGVAGDPLVVTSRLECVLWHNLTSNPHISTRPYHVPCALLKEYANTVRPIGVPVYVWLPTLLATIIIIYLCCQCVSKKKDESVKEVVPLHSVTIPEYCAHNY